MAVVPLPDEYSGEVPLAFVVLHADALLRSKDPKEAEKIKQELMKVCSLLSFCSLLVLNGTKLLSILVRF